MAKISYSSFSWMTLSPDWEDHLVPNAVHYWIAWGFGDGDAISISAHPGHEGSVPLPLLGEQILIVQNQRTQWDENGRRVLFEIKNVSDESAVFGYVVGIAAINK
jgi:hypothetical protein